MWYHLRLNHYPDHAAVYDSQWIKLAPMRNGLHFLSHILLMDLAEDAQVLCVGAGTGAELIALAQSFPGWTFTALDPSSAMLDVCRENAENAGILPRCRFHVGYIESVPESNTFDAATSILVSQFLLEAEQRRSFLHEIWRRINPGGYLISTDLAAPTDAVLYESLVKAWTQAMRFNDMSQETAQAATDGWGKGVAILNPKEIEAIIASSGFEAPTLFYQSLFIHAWYAKRI